MLEIDKIYNEDCFEGMKGIPDKSIDIILTDPPYGILQSSRYGNENDPTIDINAMWAAFNRVIKPNGAMIVFGVDLFSAKVIIANEKYYRYSLVWKKQQATNPLQCNKMPMRIHEDIMVFYKRQPVYHPQMRQGNFHTTSGRIGGNIYRDINKIARKATALYYPTSILEFSKDAENFHPSQKPISLIEWLLVSYSDRGGLCLDPFMGSGTTAAACRRTGRHYIGFERNKKFWQIAVARAAGEDEGLFKCE